MVSDFGGDGEVVRFVWQEWQAMSLEVVLSPPRYHNHLDKNINNEEWSLEEEDKLFEMQDRLGNKWALISSKLPGRYVIPYDQD